MRRAAASRVVASAATGLALLAPASAPARAGLPNITLRSAKLTTPHTVSAGAKVWVSLKVRNAGPKASKATDIAVVLSKDARKDGGDLRLAGGRLKALRPGRSVTIKVRGKVPAATAAGTWSVLACAATSRRLRETSKGDNCRGAGKLVIRGGVSGLSTLPTPASVGAQSVIPAPPVTTAPTPPTTPNPVPAPDPLPALAIGDASVDEGDEGTRDLTFEVHADRATNAVASAAVTVVSGTADVGTDVEAFAGRLTITPGTLSTTVTLRVRGDVVHEPDEVVRVVLSDARNATIADGEGVGTIHDDDPAAPAQPHVNVDDIVVTEGDVGTRDATFTVRLDAPAPAGGVAVHAHTIAQTAADPEDFHGIDARVAIAAGAASATVEVPIVGDTAKEADETFAFQLTAPEGGELDDATAVATIQDDDDPATLPEQPDAPILSAPPDPQNMLQGVAAEQASPSFAAAANFLYEGGSQIQTGVATGAIADERAAVLRGRVTDAAGQPVVGARVRVHDVPALGQTATRDDGRFDLVVNGGGDVTIDIDRAGYLSSQRTVTRTAWGAFAAVDDVVLRRYDSSVAPIAVDASQPQVAESTAVSDAAGNRKSLLVFMPGTDAEATLPDGSKVDLGSLAVRSTEYTSGVRGTESMPGELPPTSGFTYAAELSADEAVKLGATDVRFSRPVVDYVDNFLGFKAGMAVPTGYYDRDKGQWVPSKNGLVIDVVSETGGLAEIDVTGEGTPDGPDVLAAKGITEAERRVIAQRYVPGASVWRVEIQHFTPWDYNWPYGPPKDAEEPCSRWNFICKAKKKLKQAFCKDSGSIIECERQTLRERFSVPGTPYTLNYASDRGTARPIDYSVDVKATGPTFPDSLKEVRVSLEIAGRTITRTLAPAPSQTVTMSWDGLDAYGRRVMRPVEGTVKLSYVYPLVYQAPADFSASFGRLSGTQTTVDRAGLEIAAVDERKVTLGSYDPSDFGLGGLTLDALNAYDPASGTVFLGDGSTRTADSRFVQSLNPYAGTGEDDTAGDGGPAVEAKLQAPVAVGVQSDGATLIADTEADRVRRVATDGTITTFAGTGDPGSGGNGGPATAAQLYAPSAVAVTAAGSALIAESQGNRVRLVSPAGRISTVAGGGAPADGLGDGAAATGARLHGPSGVVSAAGGGFYVADSNAHRVRLVGADGIISTVAGTGVPGDGGDGGPASTAELDRPTALAVDGLGRLLIADTGNHRVRRIGLDGRIETIAGGGTPADDIGDGGPAIGARLRSPVGLAVTDDGDVLVADLGSSRVRRVYSDGTIGTLAGSGSALASGTAVGSRLSAPAAVAVSPDGRILIGERDGHRVVAIGGRVKGIDEGDVLVPSDDESEIWQFRADGRHVRTLSALTGTVMRKFAYDSAGQLTTITSGVGPVTRIERDADGVPTAIIAPSGARTALEQNAAGHIATITTPAGAKTTLSYDSSGLLTGMDRGGVVHTYDYDDQGRVTLDRNLAVEQTLSHTEDDDSESVTLSVTGGSSVTYTTRQGDAGAIEHTVTRNGHMLRRSETLADGTMTVSDATGATVSATTVPDLRFGASGARTSTQNYATPGGAKVSLGIAQFATGLPDNGNDPFAFTALGRTVDAGGRSVRATYDVASRTTTSMTAAGQKLSATLDAEGRIVASTFGNRATATYAYDGQGRPIRAEQAGRVNETEYGADGLESVERDPLGQEKRFTRDADGQPTRISMPGGRTEDFGYDAAGNVTSVTPDGRPVQRFTFDAAGAMTSASRPALSDATSADAVTHYDRDQTGRLTAIRRPGQDPIVLGYSEGRLSSVTAGGRTLAAYDQAGGDMLSALHGPDADVAFTSDGSLLNAEHWSGAFTGTMTRSFDGFLRTAAVAFEGTPVVDYDYDVDGQVRRAGALSVTRDASTGDPVGTDAGQLHTALERSNIGEISRLKTTDGDTAVFDEELQRDALGRVTHSVEHDGATVTDWGFAYAADGALSTVRRNGTLIDSYTYDAHGNRTAVAEAGAGTITADIDQQDAMVREGTEALTYRKSGELVRRADAALGGGVTTYDYDERGALRSATLPDAKVSYQLDGAGRRIGRRVDTDPWTHWVYTSEGRGPSVQLADDGSIESRFIYGSRNEVPDLMLRDGKTYALVTDHRGSVRRVVDIESGEVSERLDYDPWGRVTVDTKPGFQPFGFAGGLYDDVTGLVHFGARDYDARLGRWTAPDPAFAGGGDTNLYAYLFNDPENLRDPAGRFIPILAAAAAGGVVGCFTGGAQAWICGESLKQIALGCGKGAIVGAVGTFVAMGAATVLPATIGGLFLAEAASATASTSVKYLMSPEDFTLRDYAQDIVVGTLLGVALKGTPWPKPKQHPGRPITKTWYSDHPTSNKIEDYYVQHLAEEGTRGVEEQIGETGVDLVVQEVDPDNTGQGGGASGGW